MFNSSLSDADRVATVGAGHSPNPLAADGLPPAVLARWEALAEARDAAFATVRASWERMQGAKAAKIEADNEVRRLHAAVASRTLMREGRQSGNDGQQTITREVDKPRLDAAHRAAQLASDRLERAQKQYDDLNTVRDACGRACANAEEYLSANKGRIVEATTQVVTAQLRSGEAPADGVARVRAEMANLQREAKSLRSLPVTIDEAKAAARRSIDQLASAGRPGVDRLFYSGGKIEWNATPIPTVDVNGYIVRVTNAAALVAFLFKPALVAALDAEIEAVGAELPETISEKDRQKRLADIDKTMLTLGYAEVAFIGEAAESGHVIPPRPNADPRALLGLDATSPKAKK